MILHFKAQWSIYEPHSGHYTNRTVATIRTAQWSLYEPHSGHYTNRTVVTICTAQFSVYEGWNFNSGNYLFTTDTK